jgi:sulfate adenylyltransferase large subunit
LTILEELLIKNEKSDLLCFATAGSVDDGKSTLIGRLLFDSKSIFEDQLDAIRQFSAANREQEIDYSLVTDGLKSEREQGITIDVAYRYFSTPKRRFIIADTPGHEQYTRNMATGASTASLALILIDATKGVVTQTKRHSFISSLLGIKHFVVAVNKMDLVDFSEDAFTKIVENYRGFSDKLPIESLTFIPISALKGDNVIERSESMAWYRGSSLLDYLENVNVSAWRNLIDFRFPVQYVNWSGRGTGMRGYSGTVTSGIIRAGENVTILPSGKKSRITKIVTFEGELPYAYAPQVVTIYLEDDIDISRGDMIVRPKNIPSISRNIEANVVWMDSEPLQMGKTYHIKHTTRTVRGVIDEVFHRFDPEDLHRKHVENLHLNEIGKVSLSLMNPVFADAYEHNRQTGCFIIIDPVTNQTAGAAMVTRCRCGEKGVVHGSADDGDILTRWFISGGLVDSGRDYFEKLRNAGIACLYLDDDILNNGICIDVDRGARENLWLQRVAHVCRAANDSGVTVILESGSAPDGAVQGIIGENNLRVSGGT